MSFRKQKYARINSLLSEEECASFWEYTKQIEEQGLHDEQVPGAKSFYGDSKAENIMLDVQKKIETVVGEELLPTYAYFRIYKPGDELLPHTDRPACEVSATVCMGYDGNPWPIHLLNDDCDVITNDLCVGDAIVYLGMDVEHWREKYVEGKRQVNIFLHYVKKNGLHAKEAYDGREKTNAGEE